MARLIAVGWVREHTEPAEAGMLLARAAGFGPVLLAMRDEVNKPSCWRVSVSVQMGDVPRLIGEFGLLAYVCHGKQESTRLCISRREPRS